LAFNKCHRLKNIQGCVDKRVDKFNIHRPSSFVLNS
jgi:hypothetical protein